MRACAGWSRSFNKTGERELPENSNTASNSSHLSLVAVGGCLLAVSSANDHPLWRYSLNALAVVLFERVVVREIGRRRTSGA